MPPTAVTGPPILDSGVTGRMNGALPILPSGKFMDEFALTPGRLIALFVPAARAAVPIMLKVGGKERARSVRLGEMLARRSGMMGKPIALRSGG
jgi:hypothetical protein